MNFARWATTARRIFTFTPATTNRATPPTDRGRRNVEAQAGMANADALAKAPTSSMRATLTFTTAVSPCSALPDIRRGWTLPTPSTVSVTGTKTPPYLNVHTQSGGAITGGGKVDDRFDWQLVTGEFLDGEGLSYIDGTHRFWEHRHPRSQRQYLHRERCSAGRTPSPGYSATQAGRPGCPRDQRAIISRCRRLSTARQNDQKVLGAPETVIVGADAKAAFTAANTATVVARPTERTSWITPSLPAATSSATARAPGRRSRRSR